MKICAAADIHYPQYGEEWSAAVAERMCSSGADVIVLGGDICSGEEGRLAEVLGMFAGYSGGKLYVPGNHELWQAGDASDTWERYRRFLPQVAADNGFHYLPNSPYIVDGVGFVGTVGWYDYSFRVATAPEDISLTIVEPYIEEGTTRVRSVAGRNGIGWEELTEEDYAAGGVAWDEDGQSQSLIWNDVLYTDWGMRDGEVTGELLRELRDDIGQVAGEAQRLVGVCHCVPFGQLLSRPPDSAAEAYTRAYMGSERLGEVFMADSRFRLVLCGHDHHREVMEIGELVAANCSVAGDSGGPLLLTLPDADGTSE